MWSALGGSRVLDVSDPILGLSFGHLMFGVGALELVAAGMCWFGRSQRLGVGAVTWLATSLAVYRVGLWQMGWHRPCSCLGTLTDSLHIRPQTADSAMKIILTYLLIGGYTSVFLLWREKRAVRSSSPAMGAMVPGG